LSQNPSFQVKPSGFKVVPGRERKSIDSRVGYAARFE
jgi:hypothetical protein